MSVGVIAHVKNPTASRVVDLAGSAEEAGADWVGFADAFWWRDSWMLLAAAAMATKRIGLGPAMTNPYLRHPFHTVSAIATLHEMSGGRAFLGLAAGGSEVSGAAGISRADAGRRVEELVSLLRRVADGGPLDLDSGRHLDVSLPPTPVLVAARGDGMLRAAGRCADRVLMWAVPDSDLDRTVSIVRRAAAGRESPPELVWAPLLDSGRWMADTIREVSAYACLNAAPDVLVRWGLDESLAGRIRSALLAGGAEAAADLVPAAVLDDLVVREPDARRLARRARALGVTGMAVPCPEPKKVLNDVALAEAVLEHV